MSKLQVASPSPSFTPVTTQTSFPSSDDWEDLIRVYAFNLYWINARSYRMYLQRSIVITTKRPDQLERELDILVDELASRMNQRKFEYELIEQDFLHENSKRSLVFDSAVTTISRPLSLARRSKQTGKVYGDPNMNYCPHTGSTMPYFITAGAGAAQP